MVTVLNVALTFYAAQVPVGVRTMRTDQFRGSRWTQQLIDGHPGRLYDITRLSVSGFKDLIDWMLEATNLDNSDNVLVEEKVLIFLFISTQGASYRLAAECFQHSTDTIHQ
jgi:hypothetical protein